jgi:hypothetical protein
MAIVDITRSHNEDERERWRQNFALTALHKPDLEKL